MNLSSCAGGIICNSPEAGLVSPHFVGIRKLGLQVAVQNGLGGQKGHPPKPRAGFIGQKNECDCGFHFA